MKQLTTLIRVVLILLLWVGIGEVAQSMFIYAPMPYAEEPVYPNLVYGEQEVNERRGSNYQTSRMNTSNVSGIDIQFHLQPICNTTPSTCVDIQIRENTANSFQVGSQAFFFQYNTDALDNPVEAPTTAFDDGMRYTTNSTIGGGNVSIDIPYNGGTGNGTLIDQEWLTVVSVCFDIVDETGSPGFTFSDLPGFISVFQDDNVTEVSKTLVTPTLGDTGDLMCIGCTQTINTLIDDTQSFCESGIPNLASAENTLDCGGACSEYTIAWFTEDTYSTPYNGSEFQHPTIIDGSSSCALDTITLFAQATCSVDKSKQSAGTLTINLYPTPQAPTITRNDDDCNYIITPACEGDQLSVNGTFSLPPETSSGDTLITVTSFSGEACMTQDFTVSYRACPKLCTVDAGIPTPPNLSNNTYCLYSNTPVDLISDSFETNPSGEGADTYVYLVTTSADSLILGVSDDGSFDFTDSLGTGVPYAEGEYCVFGFYYSQTDINEIAHFVNGTPLIAELLEIPAEALPLSLPLSLEEFLSIIANLFPDPLSVNNTLAAISQLGPLDEVCFSISERYCIQVENCVCSTTISTLIDTTQPFCESGTPDLAVAEATLDCGGDCSEYTIAWFTDEEYTTAYDGSELQHTVAGKAHCAVEPVTLYAQAICNKDNSEQPAGTLTINLYPMPKSPTIEITSIGAECTYEINPACPEDLLNVDTLFSLASGEPTGTISIQVTSEIANTECTSSIFDVPYEACPVDPCLDLTAGNISLANGDNNIIICSGDGIADSLVFTTEGASNENFAWVVTDEDQNILTIVEGDTINFEEKGVGVSVVYGVAFIGALSGTQIGDLTADCLAISESVITINCLETPDASTIPPNISICNDFNEGDATLNLNGLILGDTSGSWSGEGVTGNTFDADGLAVGDYEVTYTVSGDEPCGEASSTQLISVQDCNLPPTAPDSIKVLVLEGTGDFTFNIIETGNIIDPEGDAITVVPDEQVIAGVGIITVAEDGTITFTPEPGFNTSTTITVVVQDATNQVPIALTITVTPCVAQAGTLDFQEGYDAIICPDEVTDIQVVGTGFNEDAGFTQWYLLVDESGTIIAMDTVAQQQTANEIGAFNSPDIGGSYSIYAINFDIESGFNLPRVGQTISEVSAQAACFHVSDEPLTFEQLLPLTFTTTVGCVDENDNVSVDIHTSHSNVIAVVNGELIEGLSFMLPVGSQAVVALQDQDSGCESELVLVITYTQLESTTTLSCPYFNEEYNNWYRDVWIKVTGGLPPYSFTLEDDWQGIFQGQSQVVFNDSVIVSLPEGSYSFNTTDANNCSVNVSFVIIVPNATTIPYNESLCNDNNEGNAILDLTTLVAGDTNGTWTGIGVDNNTFDATALAPDTYTLTYKVSETDCETAIDSSQQTITVIDCNLPPTLPEDTINIPLTDGNTYTFNIIQEGNITDPEEDPMTVVADIQVIPDVGTITVESDGTITFEPDPNFTTSTTITITIQDPTNEITLVVIITSSFTGVDEDNDGADSSIDCDDTNPLIGAPGNPCDDGDPCTEGEHTQDNCDCTGGIVVDNDNDGICAAEDCNDEDANLTVEGASCDDGDATTENDVINSNCICQGTPPACTADAGTLAPLNISNDTIVEVNDTFLFCAGKTITVQANEYNNQEGQVQGVVVSNGSTIVAIEGVATDGTGTSLDLSVTDDLVGGSYQVWGLNYAIEEAIIPAIGDDLNEFEGCFNLSSPLAFEVLTPIELTAEAQCTPDGSAEIVVQITGGLPEWNNEGSYQINFVTTETNSTGVLYQNGQATGTIAMADNNFNFGGVVSIAVSNDGALCESEAIIVTIPTECPDLGNGELTCAEYRERDSLALVALYHATGGDSWAVDTGWLNAPLGAWHGITLSTGDCQRVEEIDLSTNGVEGDLPDAIGFLTGLKRLDFGEYSNFTPNAITSIPSSIGNLDSLQFLSLSNNSISEIPIELSQLSSLQILDLSFNSISEIPIELSQLSSLQKLDLGFNSIIEIPIELGQLRSLQELYLRNNSIIEIPIELGQLSDLQLLSLHSNSIIEIPIELAQLSSLQELSLDNNSIIEIPIELGQLSSLQRLSLSNNSIIEIPIELGQLSSLQELYLSNNSISEIPIELGQLSSLQELYLSNNSIIEIPIELGQLSSLQRLSLYNNSISEIPIELGQLSSLQRLWIHNNQLTYTIESLVDIFKNINNLRYAPQDILPLQQTNNTLSVHAGGTPSNNTYYWYKEGIDDPIAIIPEDSIYTPTESGTYYCQITNKIVTDSTDVDKMLILTTESKTITVTTNTCPVRPIPLQPLTATNNVMTLSDPNNMPAFCAQADIRTTAPNFSASSDSAQVVIVAAGNTIVQTIDLNGGEATFSASTLPTGQYQLFALQYQVDEFTLPNIGDSLDVLANCIDLETIQQQDFIVLAPIQIELAGIQSYVSDTDFTLLLQITGGRPAWDGEGSYQINYINATTGSTGVIYENGFAYATIRAIDYGMTLGEAITVSVSNDGALCESTASLHLFIDQDQDGIPEGEDCDDTNVTIGGEGDPCNLPNGDIGIYDNNCNCVTPCTPFGGDTDGDGVCDEVDCAINDPLLGEFCYCEEEEINACPLTLSVRKRCVLADNTYEVIIGWSGQCIDSTAQLLIDNAIDTLYWGDIANTAQDSIVLVYPAEQERFEVTLSSLNVGCEQTLSGRSPCNIEFCDITYLSLVNSVCTADGDRYTLNYSWTGGPYPAFAVSDLTGQGMIDTSSLQNPQTDSTGIFTITYPIEIAYELEFTDQDFAFCRDVETGSAPSCDCKATLGLEEYIYYYCSDSVKTDTMHFTVDAFDPVPNDALWGWTLIYCATDFSTARSKSIDLVELLRTGEEGIDWETLPDNYLLGNSTGMQEMAVGPFVNKSCSEKVWNAALVAARFEPDATGKHQIVELDTNCYVNTTHIILPRTHTEIIQTGTCDAPPSVQIQAADGTICGVKQGAEWCTPLEYAFSFKDFFRQPNLIGFIGKQFCLQIFHDIIPTDCTCTCDIESNFAFEEDTVCIQEKMFASNMTTGIVDRSIWKKNGAVVNIAEGTAGFEFTFDAEGSHEIELISQRILGEDTICVDDHKRTILVKASLATPAFTATIINENNQVVQFDIVEPIADVAYIWDFGGVGVKNSEAASGFTYTYEEAGTYTVTLTASDDCSSMASTETVSIAEDEDCPNLTAGFNLTFDTICIGTTAIIAEAIDNEAFNVTPTTVFTWQIGKDTIQQGTIEANGHLLYHDFDTTGTFKLDLQLKDGNCISGVFSDNITVEGTLAVDFTVDYQYDDNGDFTGNVCFFSSITDADVYQWIFNDGGTVDGGNVSDTSKATYNFTRDSIFQVELIITHNNCTNSVSHCVAAQPSKAVINNEGESTITAGETLSFTNQSTPLVHPDLPPTYQWLVNGQVINNASPDTLEHIFLQVGENLVQLVLQQGAELCYSDTATVTIMVEPAEICSDLIASFMLETDTVCVGEETLIAVASTSEQFGITENTLFVWSIMGEGTVHQGTQAENGHLLIHSFATASTYNITLQLQEGACVSNLFSESIEVVDTVAIDFSVTYEKENDELTGNVCFSPTFTDADHYQWIYNDAGNMGVKAYPTYAFTQDSIFSVELSITQNGCTQTVTRCIPSQPIETTIGYDGSTTIATGTPLTFTNLSTPLNNPNLPVTYQWWRNGVEMGNSATGWEYTFNEAGTHTIVLRLQQGCFSDTDTLIFEVSGDNLPPDDCDWSVILMEDDMTICSGTTTTFHIAEPDNTIIYTWSINDVLTNHTGSEYTVTFPDYSPSYTIKVTGDKEGCDPQTDELHVIVMDDSPSFSASKPEGYKVSFANYTNPDGENPTYRWDFGDEQTSTQTHPVHHYTSNGDYKVCLTVNTTNCGEENSCQMVTIE